MQTPHTTPRDPTEREGGTSPADTLRFTIDGDEVLARRGQSVAAALLAQGRRQLRRSSRRGQPRGLFCAMGVCFECVVKIDGRPNALACQTPLADGMRVETQQA